MSKGGHHAQYPTFYTLPLKTSIVYFARRYIMISTGTDARRHNFTIIDNEIVDCYSLGPFAGWLYVVILHHINQQTGVAFPSLSTLAKECGMSEPTVIKYLSVLEDNNLIRITKTKAAGKKAHEKNHYTALPVPKVVKEVDQGGKANLPGVVKEVKSNKTNGTRRIKQEQKTIAGPPTAVGATQPESSQPKSKPRSGRIPRALMNAILEKLIAVLEYERDTLTETDWSGLRGVASEIGAAGATPEDIEPLYRFVRDVKGPALGFTDFTEQALKKYWKDYVKEGRQKSATEPDYTQGDPFFDPAYRNLSIVEAHELDQRRLLEQLEKLDKPA